MDRFRLHTSKTRHTVLAGVALVVALTFASIGPAGASLATPTAIGPGNGAAVTAPPIFAWQPVTGADKYEFELSANPGFDSSVAAVTTRNTRATLKEVIANGSYYWRVRAITAAGATGPWTSTRSLEMAWTAKPSLLSPANGSTLVYPSDAFRLEWTPIDGASEYFVSVATDPALGSLVWTSPVKTSATSFTLSAPLAPGTYYWAVTPLDAEGHAGTPATTASFQWSWPSTTTTTFTDLAPAPEIVDPSFSWATVPGAAGYEVEVNSSSTGPPAPRSAARRCISGATRSRWAAGSPRLCSSTTTPTTGACGRSTRTTTPACGTSATRSRRHLRTFRPRPRLASRTSGCATTSATRTTVWIRRPSAIRSSTGSPVLSWNPVPGVSSYQVDVTPFETGACNWSHSPTEHWVETTSSTSWTPLGWGWNNVKPFPNPASVSADTQTMVAGHTYCVRVRPSDRASSISGPTAFGDWTYLPQNNTPAFTWADPAVACT